MLWNKNWGDRCLYSISYVRVTGRLGWVGVGGIGIIEFRDGMIGDLVVGFGFLSIGWTITFFLF